MAKELLFDVVIVDAKGKSILLANAGLTMQQALKAQQEETKANPNTTAVIALSGTVRPRLSSEREHNLANLCYEAKAEALQFVLTRHVEAIQQAIPLVESCACVGVIASSLKGLCEDIGDTTDEFDMGFDGRLNNKELVAALGFDVESVHKSGTVA